MADLPTVDLEDFGIDKNSDYWKKFAAQHSGGASVSAAQPRSAWEIFVDSIHNAMSSAGSGLNAAFIRGNEAERENDLIRQDVQARGGTPSQAEAIIRQNQAQRAAQINERRAQQQLLAEDESRRRSTMGNIAAKAAGVAGDIVGDINPSYLIPAFGETLLGRIAGMGGVTGGADLSSQLDEYRRGIRDNIDPMEVGTSAAAGAAFQGAGEGIAKGISKAASAWKIRSGASMPNFSDLLDTVISNEGGGTLANPKTSKKGAMSVMQVMPDTARDPGFGIRPWDGKSQADLARVGRQYLAALNYEFNGNPDMVLAAYNGGVGRVKSYVARYGDNWLNHMPGETQAYVAKGLDKMGVTQGPDNLGESSIVEQPSAEVQKNVNERLAPSDELQGLLPQNPENLASLVDNDPIHIKAMEDHSNGLISDDEYRKIFNDTIDRHQYGENVVDMDAARRAKDYKQASEVIDQLYDKVHGVNQSVVDSERPLNADQIAAAENTRSNINNELQKYEPGTPEHNKLLEIDDMLKESIAYSGGNPRNYAPDALERHLVGGLKTTEIANDTKFPVYDAPVPGKTLHEYTDAEWNRLGPMHKKQLIDEANAKLEQPKQYDRAVPGKTLHEYTDAEWNRLHPADQEALVRAANEKQFGDEFAVERDTNPPASSSSFGTRRPEGINSRPPEQMKAPEGHEEPKPELKKNYKKVIDKLGDALEQGKPLRREAEAAIMKERSRRLAAVYKARGQKGGEEGFYSELAALKGEMGRPKVESIRSWFTQNEINQLYDIVKNSPNLEGYETINAQHALKKLLGKDYAEIPTAREIELLAKAMPRQAKVWKRMLEDEGGALNLDALPVGKTKQAIVNIASLPRTLKASFDFSAPFRQGMFLVGRKEFWKAMPDMFKSFFSEGHFNKVQQEIYDRPTYPLMNRAGLQTTKNNAGLLDREEAFISQFSEKIPGVRHSERAYIAFLNKLRADTFDDFVRKGEAMGIDFIHDPEYLKSAARFINSATGRGNLNAVTRDARILSNVLFSPKLMKSRVDILNPFFYAGLHPAVRKEAAKSGLVAAGTVMSVLGMAGAAGADVEMDPRSSDFAKIKIGNTRFDVTGGFQPYVRFYAQFLMGQQKGINDGVVRNVGTTFKFLRDRFPGVDQPAFKPTTRKDLLYNFFENKESPNMAEVTRLLRESDPVGNPLGSNPNPLTDAVGSKNVAFNEAVDLATPLIVSDTYQAYKDLGPKGVLTAVPNAVGVGVQTYTPKAKKSGIDLKDFGVGLSDFKDTGTVSLKDFK